MFHRGLILLSSVALALTANAHSVPSITLEAVFGADRGFEIRANIDPRLILSDNPTSLPPIEAAWYRDQSKEQLKDTFRRAGEYLRHTVTLQFGGKEMAWPEPSFQPMDGASNTSLNAETKEIHLLCTALGKAPGGDFQIVLNKSANTSLILLNSFDGKSERRPQVVFAGEMTRPFALPTGAELEKAELPVDRSARLPAEAVNDRSWWAWVLMIGAVLWIFRRVARNFGSS